MLASHLKSIEQIKLQPEATSRRPDPGLPPFLRALLVADGTVTLLLSAYFGEEIRVQTITQMTQTMPQKLALLGLRPSDEVFYRAVKLYGASSGNQYASAVSLINPNGLNPGLFEQLIDENVGMGEVLRNSARGSYREVLDIRASSSEQVQRTYLVYLEGQPAILITERFNTDCF